VSKAKDQAVYGSGPGKGGEQAGQHDDERLPKALDFVKAGHDP
jgi:hypothetical protein